jgi:hypothetical protein
MLQSQPTVPAGMLALSAGLPTRPVCLTVIIGKVLAGDDSLLAYIRKSVALHTEIDHHQHFTI